jgi:ribosomal protein S18 acetylase RimI-like enzyme
MSATQFLRLSMQRDLRRGSLPEPRLPTGYHWVSWRPVLLERHAAVKYKAFRGEHDSEIFPSLGQSQGCRRLMQLISGHSCFCAEATWMVTFHPDQRWPADDCATIQGVVRGGRTGAIQNVGVVSSYRGLGLGRSLMLQALSGFRNLGLSSAVLEVTADNTPAVRLYESLGFRVAHEFMRKRETASDAPAAENLEPHMIRGQ